MNSQRRNYAALAALLMALAVALGALGAHALENLLDRSSLQSFRTAVRYQAWHCLGLLAVQLLPEKALREARRRWISRLFILGIFFFSFSIYLLSCSGLLGIDALRPVLGPITPIGGLLLISAWLLLAFALLQGKKPKA